MVMTRAMTAKQNQEANSRKRHKTRDNNDDSTSWSNMLDEILLLIISKLGVIDFIVFSGVCKAWRTVASSNKNMFFLSTPPMHLSISTQVAEKKQCCLKDLEGRKFKTMLPLSSNRTCVGSVCGYLIMFERKTCDFMLFNLITRHELHFPLIHFHVGPNLEACRYALVYSPTMCSWGFVISFRFSRKVSIVFSSKVAEWTHLNSDFPIYDVHFFQGKIYVLTTGFNLFEVKLGSKPALIELKMKTLVKMDLMFPEFVTLGGKLYVTSNRSEDLAGFVEVDFDQKQWLKSTNSFKEHACFASFLKCGLFKLDFWMDPYKKHKRFGLHCSDQRICMHVDFNGMWYCPHKCLDVNQLHE